MSGPVPILPACRSSQQVRFAPEDKFEQNQEPAATDFLSGNDCSFGFG